MYYTYYDFIIHLIKSSVRYISALTGAIEWKGERVVLVYSS